MNWMTFLLLLILTAGCRTAINIPSVVKTPDTAQNSDDQFVADQMERDELYLTIAPPTSQMTNEEVSQREAERASLRDRISRHMMYDDAEIVHEDEDDNEYDLDALKITEDPGAWTTTYRTRKVEKQ